LTQFDRIRKFHEFQISRLFDFVHEMSSFKQMIVSAHFFSFLLKMIFLPSKCSRHILSGDVDATWPFKKYCGVIPEMSGMPDDS
jgi:hypothetical protein